MAVLEKTAPCPWENKKKYEAEGGDEGEGKTGEVDENGEKGPNSKETIA